MTPELREFTSQGSSEKQRPRQVAKKLPAGWLAQWDGGTGMEEKRENKGKKRNHPRAPRYEAEEPQFHIPACSLSLGLGDTPSLLISKQNKE